MTTIDRPPVFDGSTPHERAVALAGWLAEHAERLVTLTDARGERTLGVRTTDLPGQIVAAGNCTISAHALGRTFRVEPDRITPLEA